MADIATVVAQLTPNSAMLSPAEVLETRASSLRRLATLLRLARGAWALAVYESGDIQRLMAAELREAVAPLALVEVSLAGEIPDPLAVVRQIETVKTTHTTESVNDYGAPVVSFHAIGRQIVDLAGFLDIQRDTLATIPTDCSCGSATATACDWPKPPPTSIHG